MSKEETISEFTKILAQKDDDADDKKEKENELEVEDPNKEKEDEEGTEGDEEELVGKDKIEKFEEVPGFKEINKKYPNFFKDFPHLRHTFFHAKEYKELFPTVEDAREAIQNLEGFQALQDSLSGGKPEDIVNVLESIKELGSEAQPNFAINFLPSLRKVNQDLYYQVITPELVNFTKSMFDAGLRHENENLKNAALVASLHFFGDTKVATGEKKIDIGVKKSGESERDEKLENERASFRQERYTSFYNDVVSQADGELSKIILNGLDPKEEMTEGMKELIVEKVAKELSRVLSSDSIHTNRMNSLWKKAGIDNFSSQHKSKIIAAYLEAAKEIMPRIRAKVRANVLGIRERRSEEIGSNERRVEPKSTVSGGRQQSSNGKLDPKKIDWKKTSDLDLIRDKITFKS